MNDHRSSQNLRHSSWDHHEEYLAYTPASIMQRYLSERDRTLFTSILTNSTDSTIHAFSEDSCDVGKHIYDGTEESYHLPHRHPSPSSSGLESSGFSSSLDDRQETPWSSPEISSAPRIWQLSGMPDAVFGNYSCAGQDDTLYIHSGVAMNDVQYHHTDTMSFDDESAGHPPYGSLPQEGYQPLPQPSEEQMVDTSYDTSNTVFPPREAESRQASPRSESEVRVVRRRRSQPSRSVTSPPRAGRVTRSVQSAKRSSHQPSTRPKSLSNKQSTPQSSGAFPCPLQSYGCMSTFGSKNEWKRHHASQHMLWGFWQCVWCIDRRPNDFNRKDLFIQHLRRGHRRELGLENVDVKKAEKDPREERIFKAASDRCYRVVRSPPDESQCLMCDVNFRGPGSWEQRMEHMGRHLDCAKKGFEASIDPQDWREDPSTHAWLAKEGIIVLNGRRWSLAKKSSTCSVDTSLA